MAAFII